MRALATAFVGGRADDDALARAGVEAPAALREAWSALAAGVPEAPAVALAAAVLASARPERALDGLRALAAGEVGLDATAPGAPALARLLGGADFLARRATRMPDAVAEVCAAAALAPRTAEDAHARLAEVARADRLDHAGRTLRRNRYREMFRLTARALSGAPAAETTRELSDLADASLAAGLATAEGTHAVPGSLVVIAMGKLGGRELNYSSDVDVLFAHDEPDAGEARRTAIDRAITSLRQLLSETSEEGFVFRVDLDLRPEGRTGPLASPAEALVDFYESFGRTWERVAWIRGRPCAGELALGERIVRELQPFVYRRYGSYDVVQAVRELKGRIQADASNADRNVKLGPGGIREAEFVVQGLQSLYGGRHEALRTPNTGRALAALAEIGILEEDAAGRLGAAYALLRRVENALQMAEDRQIQELPEEPDDRRRLARRLGYADPDAEAAVSAFTRDLDAARDHVREAFESLLVEREVRVGDRSPDADRWGRACEAPGAFAAELVAAAGPAATERAAPAAQRLAESAFAEGEAHARVLAADPDAAPALALFLAADPELVTHLIRRPHLLAAFAPGDGDALPAPEPPSPDADLEAGLDALRIVRRDASVHAAARYLRGDLSEAELEAALSSAAERVLAGSLALARHHDARGREAPSEADEPARLCILALGKLGSYEMTFQSDLDLVFLYEPREGVEPLVGQEWAARLAHKLIHYLTAPTTAGRAYEVDTRLRPSGHGGALVASLDSFRHYHERRAQIWEAQALLRARPVAGDPAFGEQVVSVVQSALFEFLKYPDLAGEIARMRHRIETELARTSAGWIDLKAGPGGIVDAEFLAQYLALREGPRQPELRGGSTPHLIETAARLGLLRDAADVLGSLETLRRAQTSLRLVSGRAESAIETGSATAALVAEVVGAEDVASWVESLHDAQSRLRRVFERELRPQRGPG